MPTTSGSAITVDVSGFTRLSRDLKAANPSMQKALLASIKKQVTAGVIPAAKAAASWSTRIPGTVRASVTAKGVGIRAGGAKAPHAAAYEDVGQHGVFRHPVMGDREVWAEEQSRPFLTPSLKTQEQQILGAVIKGMDNWAEKAGFK